MVVFTTLKIKDFPMETLEQKQLTAWLLTSYNYNTTNQDILTPDFKED